MKDLISNSKRILVTSHKNCDQDGICSALSIKLILEKNFSKKNIEVCIESELQKNISFLKNFSKIESGNLFEKIKNYKPDLIIFTDSSSLKRFCENYEEVEKRIEEEKIKTILIDHHKTKMDFTVDILFNNFRSSCAQEVYHCFVKEMNLEIDTEVAEIILTGMIFDTGVFVYDNKFFRETANVVADFVEMGVNIERILSFKNMYSRKDLSMISELNQNLVSEKDFIYSHIRKEFLQKNKFTTSEYKKAYDSWVSLFLTKIEGRGWGFVIRPNKQEGFTVMFRSKKGIKNVRILAENLGGGGHDYASGATVQAKSAEEAIEKILKKVL